MARRWLALVGFSEGYGAASSFAGKYGDRLDNNQEFIAFGASNIGAGLTSGMVVGGSLSKTAANDAAKARSQLSSVVNAVLLRNTPAEAPDRRHVWHRQRCFSDIRRKDHSPTAARP